MARLKAQADILYYPTAESIVRLIATWFSNPTRSRLADPCCGKGEALATFAQAVGGDSETWGVEISYSRAEIAQRVLDVVLPASFYAVNWGQRTVSLSITNSPYDWSSTRDEHGKHLRHEWLFVSQMTPRIVPGGHHVILVPRSMLGDERFARHLVGWYRDILIFRSGEDYDRFKQVVILAAHRKERYEPPAKDQIETITGLADDSATLPELVAGHGRFVIPAAPQAGRFQYQPSTPEDLLRAAARCEVVGSDDYHRATYVRPPGAPINVAVPEKIGHMTMEISSGEVSVLSIDTPDGPILMKGMSSKAVDESAEAQYDDEGEYSHTKIEARERLVTIITVAHPDGTLERLDRSDAVGDFITRHAGAIADALLKRNRPTYDWRPTEREWDIASHVALGLPPLPGREARGLFDAQKHFAIAAARVMRKYRQCVINAQMGFGKAQPLTAKLLTPSGWIAMGEVQVGDRIIGANGKQTTVIGVYPQGEKDIFRVTFSDGSSTECCDEHLWKVNTPVRRSCGREARILPLSEIRGRLSHANGNLLHFVPIVQPVEFEEQPLPLDPYLLGVLLGDGTFAGKSVNLSTADEQILRGVQAVLPDGVSVKHSSAYDYRIPARAGTNNPVIGALKQLQLMGHRAERKFVPDIYKYASIGSRVAMLQGLMDTDGNVANKTSLEFSSVSELLAQDVVFLVQSLGGTAHLAKRQPYFTYNGERRRGQSSYRVTFRLPTHIAPFRLSRKMGVYRTRTKYAAVTRAVKSVEYVGRKPAQCIMVDALDHLYVTDDFIVTHNTSTSIGALEELDEWPALVLCPGHMVEKWRRDLERASDLDDPIAARIITRPARGEASRWHSQIMPAIEEAGGRIVDTARSQVAPVTINDPGGRRRVVIECAGSSAARLVKALQSLCTFRDNGHTQSPTIQFTAGGLVVEFVDRDDYTLFDFAADYQAGCLGRKAAAVIAFDPAKFDAGPLPVEARLWRRVWNEDKGAYERQHLIVCPACGKGHATLPWRCDNVIQESILDASGKKTGDRSRTCDTPLYEMSRWRRVGLSRLVQRKFKGLFKVYVGDEIHKCQDGRSDIGTADGRLVSAIPYGLALSGTIFGGSAGSLFHLLYRRNAEVRRLYRFKDKTRWVDHYGLWKMSWSQNEPLAAGRGLSTGIERWNYRQDELPGVSPAVIRFLLPITLFGKITDLGYTLPPLHEHIERLKMPKALKKQYEETDRQLLSEAMRLAMQDHDPGGLSIWFATMRFRPASAYRDEVAAYNSRRGKSIRVELPAVTGPDLPWLPKEVRLAEIVRRNRERGRKTLVFVEQSGTRDIRPRLQQALEALVPGGMDDTMLAEVDTSRALLGANSNGVVLDVPIRVGTLSSSDMSPAKRETWITLEAPNMDALLVNPKLIESGLDLLTFSHVVFLELNLSLYTLWQAQRRVWRLGQRSEVDVTFLVYKDTIEEALLQRMGAKMKHAMLLYGDEASGSLIEADDDDLQREMIRAALEGKTYETVGELVNGIFTTGAESATAVTESPMGSPVAMSPHMPVLNVEDVLQLDLFGGHARAMEVIAVNRKRRR